MFKISSVSIHCSSEDLSEVLSFKEVRGTPNYLATALFYREPSLPALMAAIGLYLKRVMGLMTNIFLFGLFILGLQYRR